MKKTLEVENNALMRTNLVSLGKLERGKVRDIYDLGDELLIVTTDRISAFDYIIPNGIPDKGRILTTLSIFWFKLLDETNHLITDNVHQMEPLSSLSRKTLDGLQGRTMLVRKATVLPVECVVRGYLSGSGWKSYQQDGTVCGIRLPDGLKESDEIPGEPIFTPATKAETGHDENIPFSAVERTLGKKVAMNAKEKSIKVYQIARQFAFQRGIIIADTKFEWGHWGDNMILVDEVLTPDSSRFWPLDQYQPGRPQPSFDKQFVRDWLEGSGWNKKPPIPRLPDEVVQKTQKKYLEALERLTGKGL